MADSTVDSVARIISLASLGQTQTDRDLVAQTQVGGVAPGTYYPEGTLVSEIIEDILTGSTPTTITLMVGGTTNAPTSATEEGLSSKSVLNTELLDTENGYTLNIKVGVPGDPTAVPPIEAQAQHPVICMPEDDHGYYTINKWQLMELPFELPYLMVYDSTNKYRIYFLNTKSLDYDIGGCNYRIYVSYTMTT